MLFMGIRGKEERILFDDDFSLLLSGDVAYTQAEHRYDEGNIEIGGIIFFKNGKPDDYNVYGFDVPGSKDVAGLVMKRNHLFELPEDAFADLKKTLCDNLMKMDAAEKVQLVDRDSMWVFRATMTDVGVRMHTYTVLTRHGLYSMQLTEKDSENWSGITDKVLASIQWEAPVIQQTLETKQFGKLRPLSFFERKEISADGVTLGIPDGSFVSTAAYDTGSKLLCIMDQYDGACSFLRIKDGVQAAMTLQRGQEHGAFYSDLSQNKVQEKIINEVKRDLMDLPYAVASSSKDAIVLSAKRGFEVDTTEHYTELYMIYTSRKIFIGMIMLNGDMTEAEGHAEADKWVKTIRFDASKTSVKPKIVFFTDDHPEGIPSGIDLPVQNASVPEKNEEQIKKEREEEAARKVAAEEQKRLKAEKEQEEVRDYEQAMEEYNVLVERIRVQREGRVKERVDEYLRTAIADAQKKQEQALKKIEEQLADAQRKKTETEARMGTLGMFKFAQKKECSMILEQCGTTIASLKQAKEQAASSLSVARSAAERGVESQRSLFIAEAEKAFPLPVIPVKPTCLIKKEEEQRKAELQEWKPSVLSGPNDELLRRILAVMKPGEEYTVTMIMASDPELSHLSNLKVSALLNLLVEENMVLKKVEQRKSYFLLK